MQSALAWADLAWVDLSQPTYRVCIILQLAQKLDCVE
jgi:hypothetical protein